MHDGPETPPQGEGSAAPPPGSVTSSEDDIDEDYVVDLIEAVRRDRVVLNRAKRLGFMRSGG